MKALKRNPERFTPVEWDGGATTTSFRVQIAVDSWDRPRLLEDVARTFAEHGANIVSYGGVVEDGMARNWYTAEVGDVKELRALLTVAPQPRGRLRRVPRHAVLSGSDARSRPRRPCVPLSRDGRRGSLPATTRAGGEGSRVAAAPVRSEPSGRARCPCHASGGPLLSAGIPADERVRARRSPRRARGAARSSADERRRRPRGRATCRPWNEIGNGVVSVSSPSAGPGTSRVRPRRS